jgi:hypothetical protein
MTSEPPPLYFGDEPSPESDLSALNGEGWPNQHPYWMRACRNMAAGRLSRLASERLSRITIPITSHYDWDRLRINVAHRVEPTLVKWKP